MEGILGECIPKLEKVGLFSPLYLNNGVVPLPNRDV